MKNLYERRLSSRLNHIYLDHCATRFLETLDGSIVELQAIRERFPLQPRCHYFPHFSIVNFDESYSLKPIRAAFMEAVFLFEISIKDYNALMESTDDSLVYFKNKWVDGEWPPETFIQDFLSTVDKSIEHLQKTRRKTIQFLAKARILARRTTRWKIIPINLTAGWPFFAWGSAKYTEKERILFNVEETELNIDIPE
ncbi:MAG: hypothetical protein WC924_01185 [Candidatus Gracilibacteria bacterium]